jgi:hypothetical protein
MLFPANRGFVNPAMVSKETIAVACVLRGTPYNPD